MDNITITGHTSGIGYSLYQKFLSEGYIVDGYSRSTGHDISKETMVNSIVANLKNGIFVNNAYDPVGQTKLLEKVIDKWEGSDNLIINISSKMVYFPLDQEAYGVKDYIQAKLQQNNIAKSRILNPTPRIINVIVGAVNTNMSTRITSKKIEPEDLANFIFYLYRHRDILYVQEVTVDVPGLDWKDIIIK